jgi:carbonic anhydrase
MEWAALLNCIDGRTQEKLISWVKENYGVSYVDLITAPGLVGKLYNGDYDSVKFLMSSLSVSIEKHNPVVIIVAAHSDCAGNPVSNDEQKRQLLNVKKLLENELKREVVAVFLDLEKGVEVIE